MKDAAGTGHAKKGFQVAGMVPHHRGDTVARSQPQLGEGVREAARPAVEVPVGAADNRPVRFAGNDLYAVEQLAGPLQNHGERQRKIHHRAAHKWSCLESNPRASYHYSNGYVWPNRDCEKVAAARREAVWSPSPTAKSPARHTVSFPLQKGLIFERMPLTAEVPVSLPAVARLPRLPVT